MNTKTENLVVFSQVAVQELLLDTKETCFLCFHQIQPGIPLEIHSLRNICRYFKVNTHSIFTQISEKLQNCPDISALGQSEFSVKLCTTCSSVVSHMSYLIRQLELAQLLVNYQVHRFQDLLEKPQTEKQLSGEFKTPKSDTTQTNEFQAKLVENLRKVLVEKCKLLCFSTGFLVQFRQ